MNTSPLAKPIALVIHRFGSSLGGGAEEHARLAARALSSFSPVEVLTTCAEDHHTWRNHFPAGARVEDGVLVRRFPVKQTKRRLLAAALSRLLTRLPHPAALEDAWLRLLGPHCPELLDHLRCESGRYAGFVFYTYLYPTTVFGLPLVHDRAVLVPTAHDEPTLYLARSQEVLAAPAAYGFLTPEEEALVRGVVARRRPELSVPAAQIGSEIDLGLSGDAATFRGRFGIQGPFFLYLGRIERSKGVPELLRLWRRGGHVPKAQLVLAGRSAIHVPCDASVRRLGYLSEEDKRGALAAAAALLQPSRRESLSIVVLEAWAQSCAVIADARCAPVVGQIERSGGGLTYDDPASFAAALRAVADPECSRTLGARGRAYVERHYAPGRIADALRRLAVELGWVAPLVPAGSAREAAVRA